MLQKLIPTAIVDLVRYRNLVYQLVKRDISTRYQGTAFGMTWSLILPLGTLGVYALVFGFILQPRWPNVADPFMFAVVLFTGLLIFNFFAECSIRSASLIINNANYVKKVVFPIDLLIWVPIGSALFHLLLGSFAWIVLNLLVGGTVYWTIILAPVVLLPLIVMCAGISYVLSALGVFVRDVGQVVSVGVQLLMYLGPVIYPREVLPESFQWVMAFNPITIPVEQFRAVLNDGSLPDLLAVGLYSVVACVVASLGKGFFEKARYGFADAV